MVLRTNSRITFVSKCNDFDLRLLPVFLAVHNFCPPIKADIQYLQVNTEKSLA